MLSFVSASHVYISDATHMVLQAKLSTRTGARIKVLIFSGLTYQAKS